MNNEVKARRKRLRNKIISLSVTALLVFAVGLCLSVAIQVTQNGRAAIFGHSFFRVVTGSMEPAVPEGSLIISRKTDIDTIEIGDIICFESKDAYMAGAIITHRVVGISQDEDGRLRLETKGDANLSMDGHYADKDNLVGKMVWCSKDSALTGMLSFFRSKVGFLTCIALPFLLIATYVLKDTMGKLKKDIKQAMEEGKEGDVKENPSNDTQTECADTSTDDSEYQKMCDRIRAELIEELKRLDDRGET